jgi:hypothetical protein
MRGLAASLVLLAAGFAAGEAVGDPAQLPPLPTTSVALPTTSLPLPTTSVPLPTTSLPLPTVSTPTLPQVTTPPTPAPVTSATSTVSGAVSQVTSTATSGGSLPSVSGGSSSAGGGGAGGGGAGASGGSSGTGGVSSPGASTGSAAAAAGAAPGPSVEHVHSTRPWIGAKGSTKRRTTTFVFVLPARSRVVFTITHVFPTCVPVGHFTVKGHAGRNKVRFGGRLHGRPLAPGTYRISVRTVHGRLVRTIVLVVVAHGVPSPSELRRLRAANVCHAAASIGTASGAAVSGGGSSPDSGRPIAASASGAVAVPTSHEPKGHSGVLASAFEKTADAIRPLLVGLLAVAIVLLGLASLPRVAFLDPRVTHALARHRVEIAGLGAAVLLGVALAFGI